jgi:hypothetical protein
MILVFFSFYLLPRLYPFGSSSIAI